MSEAINVSVAGQDLEARPHTWDNPKVIYKGKGFMAKGAVQLPDGKKYRVICSIMEEK